jgi:hypothetical protein
MKIAIIGPDDATILHFGHQDEVFSKDTPLPGRVVRCRRSEARRHYSRLPRHQEALLLRNKN